MAIYSKLLEFQKKGIKVTKDATNPHFKSSYASLNEVLDKVTGPLNDLGVVIVQEPGRVLNVERNEFENGLLTRIVDAEDTRYDAVSCFVPFIGATDMQKLGGAITYARRYSLVTLLGLEDEDDDGNMVSAPSRAAQKQPDTMSNGKPVPFPDETTPLPPSDDPFAGMDLPFK